MTTINLLEKKSSEKLGLNRIKSLVKAVTTAVLVIYIVSLAGFIGWEWWVSNQRASTAQNLETLSSEVIAQSAQEVVVRKIDSRITGITEFLDSRPDLARAAENLTGGQVNVVGWEYAPGGVHRVLVSAGEPEYIAEYSKELAKKYSSVAFETIIWDPDFAWTATIALGRVK